MKKLLLFSLLCLFTSIANAQVYTGNITLSSQEDVDNFSTNYPGITYVDGTLYVGGISIVNISPLSQLEGAHELSIQVDDFSGWIPSSVDHLSLTISTSTFTNYPSSITLFTSSLSNLEGLSMSLSMFDELYAGSISILEALESCTSLSYGAGMGPGTTLNVTIPNLASVSDIFTTLSDTGVYLHLPSLTSLISMNALGDGISTVGAPCTPIMPSLSHIDNIIIDQDALGGFEGLSNLTSCNNFHFNGFAIQFGGLSNLTTVNNGFYISRCESFAGLNSLESIGSLEIMFPAFNDFSELISIQQIDSLVLGTEWASNPFLTSLNGIDNITLNSYLSIIGFSDLSLCNVPSVCNFLSTATTEMYSIAGNALGCGSAEEIITVCNPENSFVYGSVYLDANCNSVMDEMENPSSYQLLEPISGATIYYSQNNFLVVAPPATALVLTPLNNLEIYDLPQSLSVTTPTFGGGLYNANVPICSSYNLPDLEVSIANNIPPVIGQLNSYHLIVTNQGTEPAEFTPYLSVITPEAASDYIISADGVFDSGVITWPNMTVSPGQQIMLLFQIQITSEPSYTGTSFSIQGSAQVTSATADYDETNNTYNLDEVIVAAYDPNDKVVNITAVNAEEIGNDALDLVYRVRFQNTGTAEAINVRLEDLLEEDIDPTSFHFISSSHDMEYSIDDQLVIFFFNNIMLPAEEVDPEGSIGAVFFKVRTNGNHDVNTTIDNFVDIYFDFNDPITTNTATTEFYVCPITSLELDNGVLTASGTFTQFEWYLNGELLENENGNTLAVNAEGTYQVMASGYYDCSSEANITIVGIDEWSKNAVALWPNPAQDNFTLKIGSDLLGADWKVIDVAGKTVMQFKTNTTQQNINISHLAPGVYTVVANNGVRTSVIIN
ncbi:MAG: T9SS type A sorting domain-containing protein [Flavobacteriales bacterium]